MFRKKNSGKSSRGNQVHWLIPAHGTQKSSTETDGSDEIDFFLFLSTTDGQRDEQELSTDDSTSFVRVSVKHKKQRDRDALCDVFQKV